MLLFCLPRYRLLACRRPLLFSIVPCRSLFCVEMLEFVSAPALGKVVAVSLVDSGIRYLWREGFRNGLLDSASAWFCFGFGFGFALDWILDLPSVLRAISCIYRGLRLRVLLLLL